MRGPRNICQGGGGSRPDGQKTVWTMFFESSTYFTVYSVDPMVFITEGRRGSNFFQGVEVSKETHITCDFPGGGGGFGPLTPSGSACGVA